MVITYLKRPTTNGRVGASQTKNKLKEKIQNYPAPGQLSGKPGGCFFFFFLIHSGKKTKKWLALKCMHKISAKVLESLQSC